jgi:hypothetical protein
MITIATRKEVKQLILRNVITYIIAAAFAELELFCRASAQTAEFCQP